MSITGTDEPTKAGVAVVDVLTGLHAAVGILAALHHRDRTGEGQRIEATLLAAPAVVAGQPGLRLRRGGSVPDLHGQRPSVDRAVRGVRGSRPPIILAVGNDAQFARLVEVLGLPALAADPRFATNAARVEHRDELKAIIEAALATRSADEWQEPITAAGVPCGPINDIAQGFALAERLGLNPVVEIGRPAPRGRAAAGRQPAVVLGDSRRRTAVLRRWSTRTGPSVLALLGLADA